jgi:hypothetical protein
MKKIIKYILIAVMLVAAAGAIFYLVNCATSTSFSARADTGEPTVQERAQNAAVTWWEKNQGTVASYGSMLMTAIITFICVRLRSGNTGIKSAVADTLKSVGKHADKFDAGVKRVEGVLDKISAFEARVSAAQVQAEKAATMTQAALKLLLQVYQSSNVPDYVKSAIGATYSEAIGKTTEGEKVIADVKGILDELNAAKEKYTASGGAQ